MLTQLLDFLGKVGVCLLILALEHVAGLPIMFMALVLFFGISWGSWLRIVWMVVIGSLLAIVYGMSFLAAIVGMAVLLESWRWSSRAIKSDVVRLQGLSFLAAIMVAAMTSWHLTGLGVVSLLISLGLLVVVTPRVFSTRLPALSL